MSFSVNTNVGAMAALQNLNETGRAMSTVQSRINTGLAVSSAKDDSATFTIAQALRSDIAGLKAVTTSLNRAKSVTDVAMSASEQISDVLNQMKSKATLAADAGIDQKSRDAYNSDFSKLRDQVATIVKSAEFNGTNLLDGTSASGTVTALKSLQDGGTAANWQPDSLTVANQNLNLGTGTAAGAVLKFGDSSTIATQADAEAMVQNITDSQSAMGTVLSTLGAAARNIESQLSFTSKLSDVVESGIGNLVDADLAKESAKLQALQVKQQLGVQALSIANQAPQSVISLFR